MEDQTISVHRYLGLDGVPFLLTAVMRPSLTLSPGPRDLLLSSIQKGLEAREEGLHLLEVSQPLSSLVKFPGQRQGLLDQWLEYAYVFEDVALAEAEEVA